VRNKTTSVSNFAAANAIHLRRSFYRPRKYLKTSPGKKTGKLGKRDFERRIIIARGIDAKPIAHDERAPSRPFG